MSRLSTDILKGVAIGAAVVILAIALALADKFVPAKSVDLFSFALVILGIVVTAITLMGLLTFQNTWNDIDQRTHGYVEKWQTVAIKEIERSRDETHTNSHDILVVCQSESAYERI